MGPAVENNNFPFDEEIRQQLASRSLFLDKIVQIPLSDNVDISALSEIANANIDIINLIARGANLDLADLRARLLPNRQKTLDFITSGIIDRIANWKTLVGTRPDVVFPDPAPTDPNFWWAQTTPILLADNITSDFRQDGLHFFGGPQENRNLTDTRQCFGAVASFALQQSRFPQSASGFFTSSPHVDIAGGVTAFAPDYDFWAGHGIAYCNLYIRHTVFQFGLGMDGSTHQIVAENNSTETLINLEDTGFTRNVNLPGFRFVPELRFSTNDFNSAADLWSEIEVRFDIYLKNAGAFVWCEPKVVLRYSQWPLTAT